jgi:hypothetical protein
VGSVEERLDAREPQTVHAAQQGFDAETRATVNVHDWLEGEVEQLDSLDPDRRQVGAAWRV